MKLDYEENIVFIKAKLQEEMSQLDEIQLEEYRNDAIRSLAKDASKKIIDADTLISLVDFIDPKFFQTRSVRSVIDDLGLLDDNPVGRFFIKLMYKK
jgi:hypothetical protein